MVESDTTFLPSAGRNSITVERQCGCGGSRTSKCDMSKCTYPKLPMCIPDGHMKLYAQIYYKVYVYIATLNEGTIFYLGTRPHMFSRSSHGQFRTGTFGKSISKMFSRFLILFTTRLVQRVLLSRSPTWKMCSSLSPARITISTSSTGKARECRYRRVFPKRRRRY